MAARARNGSRIWICLLWAVLLAVLANGADVRIQHADAQTTAETGLKARYFDSKSLSNLKLTRTDPAVNFSWGNGSPARSVAPDTFSARWTGFVEPETSGTYTFHTQTSDGVRLWVDGRLLVENWRTQSKREWSGTIPLTAEQHYSIKSRYRVSGVGFSEVHS
jgi:PA14 domain-containing protein